METQTVVVTGASAGIGRATARLFGQRGARVALIARGQAGLDGAARDVQEAGGQALAISADVADYEQVTAAARKAEERFGPIDVWVNVAFTSVFAPFSEITAEEFRRVTEVSYLGFVHGTMAALALMRPRGRGTIVQVGSALGERSIPLQSAYCGAKHAVNGFTSSLRCELLHENSGVRVTVVQMPAVNTPQFSWVRSRLANHPQPVPPIYQPEVAARGVLFAADHPGRRQYWVGASTAATLLANRVVPAVLDRYLARTGYRSQQTEQKVAADRPDNLLHPVDGSNDHGPHGIFDDKAHDRSPQLWIAQHARVSSGLLAGAAVAGGRSSRAGERHGGDAAGDGHGARAPEGPRYLRGGAGLGARPGDLAGHGAAAQPAGVPGGAGARDPAPGPGRADRGGAGAGGARDRRAGRCRACRVDAAPGRGQPGRAPGRPDRRADRGGLRRRGHLGVRRTACVAHGLSPEWQTMMLGWSPNLLER